MKIFNLFSILLVVSCTTFAKSIVKKRDGVNSKSKRANTSNECKYINSMLGKDESYNCCNFNYGEIECQNGHITRM